MASVTGCYDVNKLLQRNATPARAQATTKQNCKTATAVPCIRGATPTWTGQVGHTTRIIQPHSTCLESRPNGL